MVSPGVNTAPYAAWFACEPECGCTLAYSAWKSFLARSPRQVFDDVGELAPAVVALARIAFGVLVREHTAGGVEYGLRSEVLAGDQFDLRVLALHLVLDGLKNLRVHFRQRPLHLLRYCHDDSDPLYELSGPRRSAGGRFRCQPPHCFASRQSALKARNQF